MDDDPDDEPTEEVLPVQRGVRRRSGDPSWSLVPELFALHVHDDSDAARDAYVESFTEGGPVDAWVDLRRRR